MGRVVELLVGVSALAGIATFLGFRTAIRATLRTLGRKPESPPAQRTEHSVFDLANLTPEEEARLRRELDEGHRLLKGEQQ